MDYRLEDAIPVLRRTPEVLRSMLAGLDDRWTVPGYGDGTFGPVDVLGHLIHGERADWIPRARTVLEEGERTPFEPFDRFAGREIVRGKTVEELLDEFAALRAESLDRLTGLGIGEEDLARRGTHPAFGPVTLGQLLAAWVVHDLNHVAQVAKAMSFQYRDAVGPWREYLPIIPAGG
jgi:hypothetical protein